MPPNITEENNTLEPSNDGSAVVASTAAQSDVSSFYFD